jgi:hypothetical protein
MTPKEEALDLVEEMKNEFPITAESAAVQCALVAVKRILTFDLKAKSEAQFVIERRIDEHWSEVKAELEKL